MFFFSQIFDWVPEAYEVSDGSNTSFPDAMPDDLKTHIKSLPADRVRS